MICIQVENKYAKERILERITKVIDYCESTRLGGDPGGKIRIKWTTAKSYWEVQKKVIENSLLNQNSILLSNRENFLMNRLPRFTAKDAGGFVIVDSKE